MRGPVVLALVSTGNKGLSGSCAQCAGPRSRPERIEVAQDEPGAHHRVLCLPRLVPSWAQGCWGSSPGVTPFSLVLGFTCSFLGGGLLGCGSICGVLLRGTSSGFHPALGPGESW